MSTLDASKTLERFLQSTDGIVNTFSGHASESRRIKAVSAYDESLDAVDLIWEELEDRLRKMSGAATKAACARGWLSAHLERKVFLRSELLLATVREQSAVAASTESQPCTRYDAIHVVFCASQTVFLLLNKVCSLTCLAHHSDSSKKDRDLAARATAAMTQRGFMKAVADGARALCRLALPLPGPTTHDGHELSLDAHQGSFCAVSAFATAYPTTVLKLVAQRMDTAGFHIFTFGGGGLPTSVMPSEVVAIVDSLAGSELLAAVAALVMCSPKIKASELCPKRDLETSTTSMRCATRNIATAMAWYVLIQSRLAETGGPEGWRLAVGMLRVMRHVAVQRLQVALLDRLAAHAGMGAALEGKEEGEGKGQQQQGQGGNQADGWEGGSAAWWFAQEELGQLLEVQEGEKCSGAADVLEDQHSVTVCSTLWEWQTAVMHVALEAGVPAAPPPLLAARLAARAAEALCRLCCRQGLGGAYAPAPLWQLARAPALVLSLLPKMEHADALPPATARSCLPYWLEAAGWAAALMSDATAAAMGRLPATEREANVCTLMDITLVRDSSEASTLDQLWTRLRYLAASAAYGLETLPAATQDDVRRRLFRCGLAASLDHTLRLAYSAQDSDRSDVASDLYQVLSPAVRILTLRLAPLLPPTPQAGQATVDEAGAGSSCNDRKVGGGEVCASREQLGLLYTLSKRAAMLTRALEVQGQDGGQRQSVPEWAGHGLALLTSAMNNMNEGVRQRLWAASQAAAASGGEEVGLRGGGGASTDGACVDEAHEALAMAARAACNLAAAYAWQLAADVGAVSLAGGSAASMPLSLQEERVGPLVVSDVLHHLIEWGRAPLLLSPMQLLACQPHRLLAAACALVAALPAEHTRKQKLGASVLNAVVALSAHPTLRGRVRSWLAPPPTAAAGTSNSGGGGDGSEGCLAVPVELAVRHMNSLAPRQAALGATLLKVAAGEVRAGEGAAGGGDPAAEADGGYRPFAEPMAQLVRLSLTDPRESECLLPRLPDGARAWDHAHGQLHADGRPLPPPPSAPSGPLPPPLALPLGRAGALPRLYICGNPRCSNFGCEGEWALPLKHCGGCRAVRYCGADCQRAHWREGHRAECKALGAGM